LLRDAVTGPGAQVYWTANARDAELRLTQQTAGNGVVTSQSFDAQTGRLTAILAGTGNIVENFSYTYDVLGNVLTRADANENLTETFAYDALNRMTSATVSQNIAPVKSFAYDAIGNLLSKSDVGAYTYPLAGSALPHAVTSITGGNINTTFTYDPNGNQISGLGRSISYTSYNKPSSITQGSGTLSFSHDIDHQRFKQVAPEGITLYFDAFGVHAELFQSSTSAWYDFIGTGGTMLGVRVLHSDNSVTTRYFHTDNLGSIAVITDETGAVAERDGYDAWGKRRYPNGTDDPAGQITSQTTTRGFTGQEELADVGLVHLNGRVYDPLVGRMMSADPMVPDPLNGQAWNRYSYVINNPLAFTDPNGYCFLGMCSWGKAVSKFFNHAFRGLRLGPSIVGDLVEILAVSFCPFDAGLSCVVPAAFLSTTFVSGITSGNLGYALKAGFIAGVTAIANFEVGLTAKGLGGVAGDLFNAAGRAAVGCGSAAASGGKCGAGALAAGIPALAGPVINGHGFEADLVTNAVVGGLASVAGGGKFANGAATAAFAYAVGPHAGGASSQAGDVGWGDAYDSAEGPPPGPFLLKVLAFLLSPIPAGNAYYDDVHSPLPPYDKRDGTAGMLETGQGEVALWSGRQGPAQAMVGSGDGSGWDIVTLMHAEGHAVAWMIQHGETYGTLYINNPEGPCSSCTNNLSSMLPPGNRLTIIDPTGQRYIFTGIAR
jgi:RHS repeat-associated protein